ncbi:hypothetical protein P3T76_001962 [Phytophthora citrophthora]|uniref:Uncharacterized protein n=1 Tax=Phytophthora citrophthora TaxID=4793 RepID=A0AAD9GWI5_9STRA|nr:hypothetical protein P3T76_001962 [Phytophthora citrophthora]
MICRAITSDKSWFKGTLQPDQGHTFTYGNGTKKLSCLTLKDVSFNRKCDSNLLSTYYLAQQGFRHFQSKSGDFLFFLGNDFKLLFAAVAIGEVYYLPSEKNTIKHVCLTQRVRKLTTYCRNGI